MPSAPAPSEKPKILVVDDNRSNLVAFRKLLGRLDVETLEAVSGAYALDVARRPGVALILLDVRMPIMNGFETADRLKDDPKTRDIPIIFVTAAYNDDRHLIQGYESGAVDYIEKPVDNDVFLAKVRASLNLSLRARELKRTTDRLAEEIEGRRKAEERLEALANRLEVRITERTRDLVHREELEQALSKISEAFLSTPELSIDDISALTLEHAQKLTESKFGFVGYIDPDTGFLVCPTLTRDIWDQCNVPDKDIVFEEFAGLWGAVLDERKPLTSNDPKSDPRSSGAPEGHIPIERFAGAPAMMGDDLLGMIGVANPPRDYDDKDAERLKRLAELYAIAVNHKRTEDRYRRVARDQSVVASVLRTSLGREGLDDILQKCLDLALERHGLELAPKGCVFIADPETGRLAMRAERGLDKPILDACREIESGWCLCGRAAEGDEVVFASHLDEKHDFRFDGIEDHGHYCAPIRMGGELLGVINLYVAAGHPHREEEANFIRSVADALAGIIIRVRAEERLRASYGDLESQMDQRTRELEIFKGLLDRSTDGVFVIDPDTSKFVEANHTAHDRLGYTHDEILTLGVVDIETMMPGMDAWRAHVEELKKLGQMLIQGEHNRKDGSTLPMEINVSYVPFRDREFVVAVARDVTERRAAEEALAAKTRALQRSNDELQQFAYVASHDLQEPLNLIGGYVAVLREIAEGELGEEGDEFIGYIVDGVDRMKSLIRDLLDFSRVQSKGEPFVRADLNEIAAEAVENLRRRIEETGAKVEIPHLPTAEVDRSQFARLLQNLIGNALKYAREGNTPEISLEVEVGKKEWIFTVRDNGIGVPPEGREKIFNLFQRLHPQHEFEGTGVGLSICKRIVERRGGEIWVDPDVEVGSAFRFTLPMRPPAQ